MQGRFGCLGWTGAVGAGLRSGGGQLAGRAGRRMGLVKADQACWVGGRAADSARLRVRADKMAGLTSRGDSNARARASFRRGRRCAETGVGNPGLRRFGLRGSGPRSRLASGRAPCGPSTRPPGIGSSDRVRAQHLVRSMSSTGQSAFHGTGLDGGRQTLRLAHSTTSAAGP